MGLHTLVLVDIKVREQSEANMARYVPVMLSTSSEGVETDNERSSLNLAGASSFTSHRAS